MIKNLSIVMSFILITACSQKEKATFSNEHLLGEYSSTKNGKTEFVIKKDESGYYFQQSIENGTGWSPREDLTEMTEEQLKEELGPNWKEFTLAGLTSGFCSYFRVSDNSKTGGISMGKQPETEYFSRCFGDNFFYKIK
ncbi:MULTISPECIES: hypothetical protein [Zobellia]|uniref:hypothetical protein n=1 Tax=Zobellia TaxID=112040 RepID=UPI0002D2680C|nr:MULTISPECIES: hypothetical protein [Zobellia]MBU3024769.1 hypothetical protein [Zobellia galactanivorans]OWW23227.1 hypothetical protein B4Q04_21690 [Zobellia sp. OII3]